MIIPSYPKVNIFLHVKRNDRNNALHEIKSRFYKVEGELFDEVEILESRELKISGHFDCAMGDNLIYKGIVQLESALDHLGINHKGELRKVHIKVNKRIPIFAGLGGGSSNAASVLVALGEKFEISKETLMNVGSRIGSDVSFFISGAKSANVSGFGEIIEEFDDDKLDLEIITPKIKCSTKEVFLEFDRRTKSDVPRAELFGLKSRQILKMSRFSLNDLLESALRLNEDLRRFDSSLGREWFFSGSGSSYFKERSQHGTGEK